MYSIVVSRSKIEHALERTKAQIDWLEDLPLSAQEKIHNFDLTIRYEVDKGKFWKALLTLNRSKMAKFHEKLTAKELEHMEMAETMKGDWSLTSAIDGEDFKNDNGYLEICRQYKKTYGERKDMVEAEKIIFKEDEEKSMIERRELLNNPEAMIQALREMSASGSMMRGAVNFITGTGTKPRQYRQTR